MDSDIDLLLDLVGNRFPGDVKRVSDAATLCRLAHAGQKRKTGELYATHPVAAARLLLRFNHPHVDANAVIATLLHDTLEDTQITPEQISKVFGNDVLALVRAVSFLEPRSERLIDDQKFRHQIEREGAKDERVFLIKLADTLHNLQSISVHSELRRKEKIAEIQDWYVPLAQRVGLGDIADQLTEMLNSSQLGNAHSPSSNQ